MSVADVIDQRISTRGFLPDEVPETTIREILEIAARAPSGGNLQPWKVHVVTGAARQRVIDAVKKKLADAPMDDEAEIAVYPPKLWEPYRSRRFKVGEDMYELLAIPREDKAGRLNNLLRNFDFFDAPVGLFFSIDRAMSQAQFAHIGAFMMAIALIAEERGLATCMQEAWQRVRKTVEGVLAIPETDILYCGMALGRPDPDAPVNRLRTDRAPIEEWATFLTA